MSGKAGERTVEYEVEMRSLFKTPTGSDESLPLHRLAAKSKLSEMEIHRSDGKCLMLSYGTVKNNYKLYFILVNMNIIKKFFYMAWLTKQENQRK